MRQTAADAIGGSNSSHTQRNYSAFCLLLSASCIFSRTIASKRSTTSSSVKSVGGETDGIGGGNQRSDAARTVALIALVLLAEHFVERHRFAAGGEIELPAAGTFLRTGGEEDFALGVRKDDGALIAAFGDDVVVAGQLSLQLDEMLADAGIAGGVVGDVGDWRTADFGGDILAVEQHVGRRAVRC